MTATRVVNLRVEPYDVYIGRAGKGLDGYFGNPIRVGHRCPACGRVHASGGSTLHCFRHEVFYLRLSVDAEYRTRVLALRGKALGCFCAPGACHGDVYVEFLNRPLDLIDAELDRLTATRR